jgi:hypothetical protein
VTVRNGGWMATVPLVLLKTATDSNDAGVHVPAAKGANPIRACALRSPPTKVTLCLARPS